MKGPWPQKRTIEDTKQTGEKKRRNDAQLPKGFFDSDNVNAGNGAADDDDEWERFQRDIASVESGGAQIAKTERSLLPDLKATIEADPVEVDGKRQVVERYNVPASHKEATEQSEEEDQEDVLESERELQRELVERVAALKEKRKTSKSTIISNNSAVSTKSTAINDSDSEVDYSDEDIFKK